MKASRLIFALLFASVAVFAHAASDARSQALALYRALQKENWRALYYLAAFSPKIKGTLHGPDQFAADVQKGINQSDTNGMVHKLFQGMKHIKVGPATVHGNKATAPTSADITFNGQTAHFKGLAKMIKDGGIWKWDLSYTDDVEKATSDSIQELLGKPSGR
jgi:hypothetical protein